MGKTGVVMHSEVVFVKFWGRGVVAEPRCYSKATREKSKLRLSHVTILHVELHNIHFFIH